MRFSNNALDNTFYSLIYILYYLILNYLKNMKFTLCRWKLNNNDTKLMHTMMQLPAVNSNEKQRNQKANSPNLPAFSFWLAGVVLILHSGWLKWLKIVLTLLQFMQL